MNRFLVHIHGNARGTHIRRGKEDRVMLMRPYDLKPIIHVTVGIRHVSLLLVMPPFPIHDELILQPTPKTYQVLHTPHQWRSRNPKPQKKTIVSLLAKSPSKRKVTRGAAYLMVTRLQAAYHLENQGRTFNWR